MVEVGLTDKDLSSIESGEMQALYPSADAPCVLPGEGLPGSSGGGSGCTRAAAAPPTESV